MADPSFAVVHVALLSRSFICCCARGLAVMHVTSCPRVFAYSIDLVSRFQISLSRFQNHFPGIIVSQVTVLIIMMSLYKYFKAASQVEKPKDLSCLSALKPAQGMQRSSSLIDGKEKNTINLCSDQSYNHNGK